MAVFLDMLVIVAAVLFLLATIIALAAITGKDNALENGVVSPLLYWTIAGLSAAYFVAMESGENGATLGKRWLNIKILNTGGSGLTPARSAARLLARLVSCVIFFAGFLIQPFTARKQALHDLLAGTIVVKSSSSNKVSVMASLLVIFFAFMVPILALLATAGQTFLQQYIQTVQIHKAIRAGRTATVAVARFYLQNGYVPAAIDDAGDFSHPPPNLASIAVNQQNGDVQLTFSNTVRKDIRSKHLIFTPTLQADQRIIWKCHSPDIETRFLPDECS